ncbi:hypothetical protein F4861DRAFT_126366 [Xylaria intraflava]|nr:hypothetical protein F4861DRAFT_126366 [Xylaria intraflava]
MASQRNSEAAKESIAETVETSQLTAKSKPVQSQLQPVEEGLNRKTTRTKSEKGVADPPAKGEEAVASKKELSAEDRDRPRDLITGRRLADHETTCIRCMEKGLTCTLRFHATQFERQCAACRRSGARFCVRYRPIGIDGNPLPYYWGLPWRDPNYVALSAEGSTDTITAEELERMLREFFVGGFGYFAGSGELLSESEAAGLALPPLDSDLEPPEEGEPPRRGASWRDVLPLPGRKWRVWSDARPPAFEAAKEPAKGADDDVLGETY